MWTINVVNVVFIFKRSGHNVAIFLDSFIASCMPSFAFLMGSAIL